MKQTLGLIALAVAVPALAESTRQLDAHEHGIGALNIAIEGSTVAMEFRAPGADIVGFEYAAESVSDLAAIDTALAILGEPLGLFAIPDAAVCKVAEAQAELESEDGHDDQVEEGQDEHADDGHDGHDDHVDENHEEHAEEVDHTEFHAEYMLTCENPDALTEITFTYFEMFSNAKEVEVQIITVAGAQAFEVERDAPVLNLRR
ncbi:MAG: DUF2796 domain-containing protein [Paracoccaceae bacterium]|nr:DUF2796 domain-containing protein [Paracoccaceae bacterium]